MSQPILKLPTLLKRVVIPKEEFTDLVSRLNVWLVQYLVNKGSEEIRKTFFSLTLTVQQLQAIPLELRKQIFLDSKIKQGLFGTIQYLEQNLGEFLPLTSLKADLFYLYAETADFLLREAETNGEPNLLIGGVNGISSLEETEDFYFDAMRSYGICCETMMNRMISEGKKSSNIPSGILLDEWILGYMQSLSRFYLMKLAKRLKTIDPSAHIWIANINQVVPYVIQYPELRDAIDADARALFSRSIIERFMRLRSRSETEGCQAFSHLAILAMILNDIPYARSACKLAREYAQNIPDHQIEILERVIDTLEPQIQA